MEQLEAAEAKAAALTTELEAKAAAASGGATPPRSPSARWPSRPSRTMMQGGGGGGARGRAAVGARRTARGGGGGAAAAPLIDFGAPAPAAGGEAAALQAENAKLQEMPWTCAREAMLKAELMEARDTMNTTIAAGPAAAEEGGAKKLMGKMKMGFGKK